MEDDDDEEEKSKRKRAKTDNKSVAEDRSKSCILILSSSDDDDCEANKKGESSTGATNSVTRDRASKDDLPRNQLTAAVTTRQSPLKSDESVISNKIFDTPR